MELKLVYWKQKTTFQLFTGGAKGAFIEELITPPPPPPTTPVEFDIVNRNCLQHYFSTISLWRWLFAAAAVFGHIVEN